MDVQQALYMPSVNKCRPLRGATVGTSGDGRCNPIASWSRATPTGLIILARYSDHRRGFRAVESPAFCLRRSAARKCQGQCRRGDRSRPWTRKADRSMCDFPSFRLREHYCQRWGDMGSRAEKAPAAQRVDPAALAQLGSRVLLQLRRRPQDSAFAYLFSTT
jgi:hypothetical protein